MIKTKTFKFRLYPTKEQARLINKTIGCVRFVFNYALSKQRDQDRYYYIVEEMVQCGYFQVNNWKSGFFSKYDAIKALPELKKYYPFLKEVDSVALQASIENLGRAYDRYYKKLGGRPRYKSKRNEVQSYTTKHVNGNIRVEGNRIKLPKLGRVKFAMSREVSGRIKTATIRRAPSGKFFVSLTCKTDIEALPAADKKVGVDVGLKDFAITSDGEKIGNPKHFRQSEKRLAFLQRKLSRKEPGSRNYHKAKGKVARLHERIKNQRTDFLHKLSTRLINENQVIVIEDLSISNMLKNRGLAKVISEVSWYEFRMMLAYKADWYGRQIVVAPSNYASSQLCSNCGKKNPVVKNLALREWACPHCNAAHDRDINASRNLLKLA